MKIIAAQPGWKIVNFWVEDEMSAPPSDVEIIIGDTVIAWAIRDNGDEGISCEPLTCHGDQETGYTPWNFISYMTPDGEIKLHYDSGLMIVEQAKESWLKLRQEKSKKAA